MISTASFDSLVQVLYLFFLAPYLASCLRVAMHCIPTRRADCYRSAILMLHTSLASTPFHPSSLSSASTHPPLYRFPPQIHPAHTTSPPLHPRPRPEHHSLHLPSYLQERCGIKTMNLLRPWVLLVGL